MTARPVAPESPRRGRGRPSKGPRRRFSLRLPSDLYEEIERTAAAVGLSMNDEIISRCAATPAAAATEPGGTQ